MTSLNIFVAVTARLLLVALFLPFSALDKLLNFKQSVGQAAEAIPRRSLAMLMIAGGLGVEIVMSLAILTGMADRMAALILAAYCIVTAIVWKPFWRQPDFRLQGPSRGRETFWEFLKNLALAGGFLVLAFGATATGLQRFLAHPLASSHPYAVADRRDI
jgi:putative oxidoreductase